MFSYLQRIYFDPIPFHPLVHPQSAELNTKKEFPVWKPNVHKLWQLIAYAKRIFYDIDEEIEKDWNESCLPSPNSLELLFYDEAAKMYRDNFEEFRFKVAETVAQCHAKLYDVPTKWGDDPHAIRFGPWNSQIHEPLRQQLINGQTPNPSTLSHSQSFDGTIEASGGESLGSMKSCRLQ